MGRANAGKRTVKMGNVVVKSIAIATGSNSALPWFPLIR